MDIQGLSVNASQGKLLEEAAVKVQSMAMDNMKEQGAELARLIQASEVITDPNQGNNVNLLA